MAPSSRYSNGYQENSWRTTSGSYPPTALRGTRGRRRRRRGREGRRKMCWCRKGEEEEAITCVAISCLHRIFVLPFQ